MLEQGVTSRKVVIEWEFDPQHARTLLREYGIVKCQEKDPH